MIDVISIITSSNRVTHHQWFYKSILSSVKQYYYIYCVCTCSNIGNVILSVMRYTQNITDWNTLSLLLGLSLHRISIDSADYSAKHVAIVTKWLEGGSASWAALENALRDELVNRIDIADKIAKDHPKLRYNLCM